MQVKDMGNFIVAIVDVKEVLKACSIQAISSLFFKG
jgi:hypothetical protein